MNTLNDDQKTGQAYALLMLIDQKTKTHNALAPTSYSRVELFGEVCHLRNRFDEIRKQIKGKENRSLLTFQNRIIEKIKS